MRRVSVLAIVLILGLSTSVFAQSGRNGNGFIRLGSNQVIIDNGNDEVTKLFRPGLEIGPTLGKSISVVLGLYADHYFNDGTMNIGFEIGDSYLKVGAGYLLNGLRIQSKLFPYGSTTLNILENNLGSFYVNLRTGLTEKYIDLNVGWQFKIK